MSDDYGHTSSIGDAVPLAMAGYQAYQTYNRVAPFVKGAGDAFTGSQVGMMAAKVAGSSAVRTALAGTIARTAAATGVRAGATALAGAAAGSAALPVVGTVVGALAPLIIPHTPLAKPVRAIPVVGPWLSPKQPKKEPGGYVGGEAPDQKGMLVPGGGQAQLTPGGGHSVSGADYAVANRAEYNAGRGFRR